MSTLLATARAATIPEKVSRRIPTLDGWRGIAILLVLGGHLSPWQTWSRVPFEYLGSHGVAIFFVLSGYLITGLLRDELDSTGTISLRRFYHRRAFRILPCLLLYLLVIGLVSPPRAHSELIACLLFYRNFIGSPMPALTGHLWSLSLEEQFYIVWPAVFLLTGARWARWLAVFLACCVAADRVIHHQMLAAAPLYQTFHTQYRLDGLLVGCAFALLPPSALRAVSRIPVWLTLGLLVLCTFQFHKLIPLGEYLIIGCALVATSAYPVSTCGRVLEWKPLRWIGLASYSIYVWQNPFTGTYLISYLFLLPIVAVLSYRCIEVPFRKFGRN